MALVARGFDYSFVKSLHNVNCIEFDLSLIADWDSFEEIKGADTIFYMAWAGVSSTYKNQVEIQVSNILYGIQVMEFAHRNGISRVIFQVLHPNMPVVMKLLMDAIFHRLLICIVLPR